MSSRFPNKLFVGFVLLSSLAFISCAKKAETAQKRILRICADPNNLPFSNDKLEGFENKLAELVAREMKAKVEYVWWAQRRGFIRNTLTAGKCDVVMGVPSNFEMAATTKPYYRSSYVFVYAETSKHQFASFNDPELRHTRIGVQIIGDDGMNSPPAHALANRRIVQNVVGYSVYGDYSQANPPARIVDAVAKGEVEAAIVWGPLAGYFAKRQNVRLKLTPVSPQIDLPDLPFVYDISIGVRRQDNQLKEEIEEILERRKAEIDRLLDDYGVPRL